MRTSKERARLIHRRTAEIKQERRIKRQRRLDAACMAACLFLVIGIGALMPGLMRNTADGGDKTGTAKAEPARIGCDLHRGLSDSHRWDRLVYARMDGGRPRR